MAKTVTLSDFHKAQAGELYADRDQADQPAERDPISGMLAEQAGRATRVMAGVQTRPPHAGLVALGVERECTAEMSLSMIRARVMERSYGLEPAPTDQEIQDEADRIFVSFGHNATGPKVRDQVATVNGDGTVAEVKPAEMTPDRGEGVGVTHHDWRDVGRARAEADFTATVADGNGEQRFSGGGTADGEAVQGSMFLVPTDADFHGKAYRAAPELADIAEALIDEHGFLAELVNCEIRYFWKRKVGAPKGRKPIGSTKRTGDLLGHILGSDFAIWLAADTAREAQFDQRTVEWAIFRQLCRIGTDDRGNFISVPPDFEAFAAEIRIYGAPIENLRVARQAFQAGEQMGLFDGDAGDSDDDENDDDEGDPLADVEPIV